ncbi:MAG: 3-hydroxyacyl-CoA dehydrogenase NAD-binding domain-containing protein, partial [Burkholderiales bacterium]
MIDKIGVIGAGAMGNGIAHVCALAKLDVQLIDVNEDQLKKAMDTIRFNMERQVKRNLITSADEKAALGRIKTGLKIDALGDCDMVIEAATEKEAVKKDILKALCPVLKPTALIASNT